MHRIVVRLVLVGLVGSTGCEARDPPRSPRSKELADKAALFGDPTLVPTREGERARRELALAQEIEQAIDLLPQVSRARVDVELPLRGASGPTRVLAVVLAKPSLEPSLDPDDLGSHVRAIAFAVAGPAAAVEVVLETSPGPMAPPRQAPWPLLLGVLGLGLCGGTLLERARRLFHVRTGRARR